MVYIIKMPRMSPTSSFVLFGYIQKFNQMKCRKGEKCFFLHNTFLNKDFLLDIVRKSIKILTVILQNIMEGSMSHFLYVSLCSFFYVM